MVGITTTQETAQKGHSIRKVENHYPNQLITNMINTSLGPGRLTGEGYQNFKKEFSVVLLFFAFFGFLRQGLNTQS